LNVLKALQKSNTGPIRTLQLMPNIKMQKAEAQVKGTADIVALF
jgi:hypothetical protein